MLSRLPAAIPHRGYGPSLEPGAPRLRAWLRPRRSEIGRAGAGPSDTGAKGGIRAGAERLEVCCSDRISAEASMSVGEARKQPASRLLGSLNRRVFVANEHW